MLFWVCVCDRLLIRFGLVGLVWVFALLCIALVFIRILLILFVLCLVVFGLWFNLLCVFGVCLFVLFCLV